MKIKSKAHAFFPTFLTFNLGASRSSSLAISAALSVTGLGIRSATADTTWTGTTNQDWNTATNWTNGIPDDTANNGAALINLAGPTNHPIFSSGTGHTDFDVVVGNSPGNPGRVDQTAGTVQVGNGSWLFVGQEGGTGTYNLSGSGSVSAGALNVGAWGAGGANGTLNVNTSGTFAATAGNARPFGFGDASILVGENGSTGTVNLQNGIMSANFGATFGSGTNSSGALNVSGGTLNVTGNLEFARGGGTGNGSVTSGSIAVTGEAWVGRDSASTLTQSGGTVSSSAWFVVGRNNGSVGNYNLSSGGTVNAATTTGFAVLGSFGGSQGTLTVSGNGDFNAPEMRIGEAGTGTVNQTGGTIDIGGITHVGYGGGIAATQNGTLIVSGGTFTSGSDFIMHFAGSATAQARVTVNGGTLNVGTNTTRWMVVGQYDLGSSTVTVSSGNLNLNANTDLRFSVGSGNGTDSTGNTGANVVTLSGGAITSYSDNATTANGGGIVDLNRNGGAGANCTFHLNGGTLTMRGIETTRNDGSAVFNFNGGTLKATADNSNFINLGGASQRANVRNGGAKIDTDVFNVSIGQALVHSDYSGDAPIDGGLTKSGTGTLTIVPNVIYTGNTTVSAGTLSFTNNSADLFADTSTVSIAADAILHLPIEGTDIVAGLTLGGAIQGPGTYNQTNSGGFIVGDGSIQVVPLTGFTAWTVANAGGQASNQDFDNDGVPNGVEYFMNAVPGFTTNPAPNTSNVITWTNGGNIPHGAYGTQFVVQTSQDLVTWTNVPVGSLTTNTSGPGGVLRYTLPTGQGKFFVRLNVAPN